jgi:hypothetical protein
MAVRPAIRAPLLKYGICTAVVSAFLAASPLMAQQQSTKEAVDLITNTADKICGLIETSGSTTSAQASVEIKAELALLWQIYLRRFALQIHFLQYGHRCSGGRATNSTMAWRTAGSVG